jgi:DnaD/phage-associated family protein
MSFLLLENRLSIDTLVVPGYFIDRFLPAASGTDVKVYLYLLRAISTATSGLSSASISDHLEISEREVLRSLSYWEKAGLLRLSFTSEHELSGVAFTDPPMQTTQATADKAAAGNIQAQAVAQTAASTPTISGSMPPLHLSQEEQILLENDPEFNMYMSAWAQYFSRPLTYSDTESFGYWYLQFNRSPDVIDYLVDYCANHCKGKLSMKFIDSVAQSWHKKGLHTLDAIREYNQLHNDTVYAVMRAYGLYNQAPSPSQLNYINQWIRDYGFSTDIFVYACDITMLKCQRPSVNFTESILKRWKQEHVKTLEDAKASEQKREQDQKAKASAKKNTSNRSASNHPNASVAKGTQQFRNFTERQNNNYMEKILKQYSQYPKN